MAPTSDRQSALAGYIRGRTEPGHWVGWWFEMPESETRQQLEAILFGPDGESLQDLTDPSVRDRIVHLALSDASLSRIVEAELDQFLDEIAKGVASRTF